MTQLFEFSVTALIPFSHSPDAPLLLVCYRPCLDLLAPMESAADQRPA